MASNSPSRSTKRKAQVIMPCQLCQGTLPLKRKCMECDILICDNCDTNVHGGHETIDINDIHFTEPKPKEIKLTKLNTYATNLPFVQRLVTTRINSMWITCLRTTTLQEMQITGKLTQIRGYNDKFVLDMALSKTDDLLFTIRKDTKLYCLSKTGQINVIRDFKPLLPKAIHVSDDNIIVSTRETGDAFPLTEHSRRQIVVLHQTGKRKMTVIEYDQHNKRLFSIISSVQMDNMGNIYGVDCLTCNDIGRIVKVVKKSITWIYEGNSDINTKGKAFSPRDLTISHSGNVIVADNLTHSLHILSGEGVLIKFCEMQDINIMFPLSLEINSSGILWLDVIQANSKQNAKIHKLDITGC
ncbi:Hypothetical predicted protein [Mytilus galloprovincialis]|uniref:B box-type domain-containing protein n=1 Tax=Mytilus galloprovincialis TaxID=29158 RepID=A0A8B6CFY6_MYTGA|nr:Hypothetical predicted protein [Mytilus galloprovincialis]